ncbi:hypothetical protein [Frateuria defendens]|uniref:hypothetical protein n=1 Tax=Frateuria defendens TaxID=2219559 RepID=UPI0007DC4183|nr:hypothetical protein [Frateuria defendens]
MDATPPLHDYLRDGIVAADLPDLHALMGARELLRAFSTLFHGGEESVMVRLLVLRTLGERGAAPDWAPQELRDQFAYLDAVKFDTVLGRLREHGLLLWDGASQRYRISPVGRQALAAIGMLLQFNQEGDELAYVTAQLAAGQAVGRVRAGDLQHLLSRLNELREDFDQAVLSGSEHRIEQAAETLQSVWRWVEKGTEIVRAIAADGELDAATHRVAQQVGRAQSAMLRQASVFQRALNQLDRHRVHLGESGLSSSDVNRYLRAQGPALLATLAEGTRAQTVAPAFALAPIAVDVAEYELVEREREAQEDQSLPPAQAAPQAAQTPVAENDYQHAEAWLERLDALLEGATLAELVPAESFALSAYRLSLLGLIGDPGAENRRGVSAGLAQLPLRWRVSPEFEPVERCEVAYMSRGRLEPAGAEGDDGAGHADAGTPGHADASADSPTPSPSRQRASASAGSPRHAKAARRATLEAKALDARAGEGDEAHGATGAASDTTSSDPASVGAASPSPSPGKRRSSDSPPPRQPKPASGTQAKPRDARPRGHDMPEPGDATAPATTEPAETS